MNLFLMSDDYLDFKIIRNVLKYEHIKIDNLGVLKIETHIPIIGQSYNLGDFDPNVFYLTNRYNNNYLDKLKQFPIAVRVYIVKDKQMTSPLTFNDLQQIAWASLYDNQIDAENDNKMWDILD